MGNDAETSGDSGDGVFGGGDVFARGERVGAIVSIHGAREFGVEAAGVKRLDLEFDDCDVVESGNLVERSAARERLQQEAENGRVLRPVGLEDVRKLVDFAREVEGVERVLVHCGGGVSRGPAAAVVVLATWMGEGEEGYCVEAVLRGRRGACPHEGVLRFGDEVLGRNGKLVEALRVGRK